MTHSGIHLFGPDGSPVVLAGSSVVAEALGDAIRLAADSESPTVTIVTGPVGTGKTTAASAVQAECEKGNVTPLFLHPRLQLNDYLAGIARAEVDKLIIDGFDEFSDSAQQSISSHLEKIHRGTFLTAAQIGPWIHQEAFRNCRVVNVTSLEDRPEDSLTLVDHLWQQALGVKDVRLTANCEPDAVAQLQKGPWPAGGHSLRRCIELLLQQQQLRGNLQESSLIDPLTEGDVLTAIIEMMREAETDIAQPDVSMVQVVLEGETDEIYMRAASTLFRERFKSDPSEGLAFVAAGTERSGGANAVVKTLISLADRRIPAIGLLDNDGPGREARKTAAKFGAPPVLLPAEFDPLKSPSGQEEVEIEDLVSSDLLDRFYEDHPEFEDDRMRIQKGQRVRVVIGGPHKLECAQWVEANGTFEDVERIAYVILMLREQLNFAMPSDAPDLREWLARLSE